MSDFQVNIQKSVISRQKREISELETQLAELRDGIQTMSDMLSEGTHSSSRAAMHFGYNLLTESEAGDG